MTGTTIGATLFRWRLVVIVGAFALAATWATVALRVDTGLRSLTEMFGLTRVFIATAPLCLVAFLLRVSGEARLGAAVYGQQASARVVSGGPFRFSRHPLYLGTWLFFVAASAPFLPPAVLLVLAVSFAVALAQIGAHEERALADAHGDAWVRYANAVPRFLGIPRAGGRAGGGIDDAIVPSARDWWRAVIGNLFFLSLAVYRIGIALIGEQDIKSTPARILGAVNVLCLVVWLVVVAARRLRAR